jgi:hypothetical protein
MARGCGSRQVGGAYLRTIFGPNGTKPIWDFIFDPPLVIPEGLDIPSRGVLIAERPDGSGVFDVYDHVGSKYYPNVADFVVETGVQGLSRRVKPGPDLEKLTRESRILLTHDRAIITNYDQYYEALREEEDAREAKIFRCPCDKKIHEDLPRINHVANPDGSTMCAGLWWHDLIRGEILDAERRQVHRKIGDVGYHGRMSPNTVSPHYQPGIFLGLPIHCIDVIADPEGDRAQKTREKLTGVSLPVRLERE